MVRRLCVGAAGLLGALVIVAGAATMASAHVTVSPSSIPKGTSDVILTFRVPNESTTASVVGLKVQFPVTHPIVLVNPEAGSGWQVDEIRAQLPKPVTTDDGTFTSVTSEIDWSGGTIAVGQFGEFNVLAQGIPTDTDQLVFKAIQTYSDGTVVSWIEVPNKAVPDPPHPAPTITLTAAAGSGAATATATTAPAAAAAPTATGGSSSDAIAIAALILGGAAVLVALLAVWLGRPRLARDDDLEGRGGAAED
jgi:uncharacterized protein YcnI